MIHAYDENYLDCARSSMALMLDFAVHGLQMKLSEFYQKFLASEISVKFAAGDSHTLAGTSGMELALEVIGEETENGIVEFLEKSGAKRSREYWTGWALAYYQWESGMNFQQIEKMIPIEKVRNLYSPYHEMEISHFCARMRMYAELIGEETALKQMRQKRGLSQSQLAALTGIPVRTLQQYEQRQKDINHSQAQTLLQLAQALYCRPEELLE